MTHCWHRYKPGNGVHPDNEEVCCHCWSARTHIVTSAVPIEGHGFYHPDGHKDVPCEPHYSYIRREPLLKFREDRCLIREANAALEPVKSVQPPTRFNPEA